MPKWRLTFRHNSRFTSQQKWATYLAVAAAMVLVVGYIARPQVPSVKTRPEEPTISQSEIARLREQVRANSFQQLAKQFSHVADRSAPAFIWARGLQRTAVVWPDATTVLVTRDPDALPRPASVTTTGGSIDLSPANWLPGLPFSTMRSQTQLAPPARARSDQVEQGSWVVLVSRRADGHVVYASGTFSGTLSATCGGIAYQQYQTTIPLQQDLAGSGLFDMDGSLLGVVVPCDAGPVILRIDEIARALDQTTTPAMQILSHYGMRLEPLSDQLAAYFGRSDGLLVSEVWDNWPAARGGVMPGDILTAVDHQPLTPQSATPALPLDPEEPVKVSVVRGRKTIELLLDPREQTLQSTQQAGIIVDDHRHGVLIRAVLTGTPEARAGISPGDELIALLTPKARRTVTTPAAAQFSPPMFAVLRRGSRSIGLMVTP